MVETGGGKRVEGDDDDACCERRRPQRSVAMYSRSRFWQTNVLRRGTVTPIEAAQGAAATVLMFYACGGAFAGVCGSRCAAVYLCRYGVVVTCGGRSMARQARAVASMDFAHCFQASRR